MKLKPNYWVLAYALFAFAMSLVAVVYSPRQVPIHWNMQGEIDGYGSKYIYLIFGCLGFLGYFLMNIIRKIDPNSRKIEKNLPAYAAVRNIISVLLSTMALMSIASVLIKEVNVSKLMVTVMGVFMVVIGNIMPRIPHNYFSGVKTPWALNDETNWKKTQRVGGYCFVCAGFLMIIAGVINAIWVMVIAFSFLMISMIGVYIYSWYIYKKSV